MQCVNWLRICASGLMRLGQAMTIGSRVPPRWLAICLPHWKGVLLACAQAAAKCGAVYSPPVSMPPNFSISANCCSAFSTMPLKKVVSLKEPVVVPSMLAPLSPQM